jgi:membrane fusion protein
MNIFRKESYEQKKHSLWGNVLLAPQQFYIKAIGALTISAFFSIILVMMSQYSLRETVTGFIEPQKGIVRLYSPVTGYISELTSEQGERVKNDQILMKVSDNPKTHSGENFDSSYRQLLLQDYENYEKKLELLDHQEATKVHEINLEKTATQESLKNYEKQHQLLLETVSDLKLRLVEIKKAFEQGAISELKMKQFEDEVRMKEQELLNLEDKVALSSRKIEQLELKQIESEATFADQRILLSQQKIDIQKKIIEFDRQEGVSIYSPSAMKITQLNVQEGQYVQNGEPLLDLEHLDDIYIAILHIPEKSIGLIEEGMSVNIRLHAYPYEHYGILSGVITKINQSSTQDRQSGQFFYKAFVSLNQQVIYGNGKEYLLRQGLVFEADIKTQKITLLDKIFEPLKKFRRL